MLLPSIIAAIAVCVIASQVTLAVFDAQKRAEEIAARDAEVRANTSRIIETLAAIQTVSTRGLTNGFWISYPDADGSDSLYFVDITALAQNGLTAEQLQDLASRIRDSEVIERTEVRALSDDKLPTPLQFHNSLYASTLGGTSTLAIEKSLEQRIGTKTTSDDLFALSYLRELQGDYAARDALNTRACSEFGTRCASFKVTLAGTVVDSRGDGVQGALVEVSSRPELKGVVTDAKGAYRITVPANPVEKFRVRASKRNFSDGFVDTVVVDTHKSAFRLDPIQLSSPIAIVTADFAKKTVTGAGSEFRADGSIVLHTAQSIYEIPAGAIVHEDGSPYRGDTVDVYLYEFSKGNPPDSLTRIDTFDAVIGYAGNLMKTFGMPYIQFFAPDGEELHVLRSRPMVLTYTIVDMQALRTNADKIYRPLTDADLQLLVDASVGQPYRIDRQFLIDHQMLQFPAFWVLDRKRGVWDNIGVSVLSTQGVIKSLFYTIRDDIH